MSKKLRWPGALGAIVVLGIAWAEEPTLGMKLGAGHRLLLNLESDLLFASNYYYSEDDEESATGLLIRPAILLTGDRGELRYDLGLSSEAAALDLEGDKDDYFDTRLHGSFVWAPLTRHLFSGKFYRADDHDPFGIRRTEGTVLADRDLDEWTQHAAAVTYRFGVPTARINLEAELNGLDREYTTNRSFTRFLDYDTQGGRGTIFYNLSSKTALLAEVLHSNIDYDAVRLGVPSRAGDLTRFRVGATWKATGKTTGEALIGRVEREFDDNRRPDFTGTDWQIGVTWSPRVRDTLKLTTSRLADESYLDEANFIDTKLIRVAWSHDWTGLITSNISYEYATLEFDGFAREDDVSSFKVGLEYAAAPRWSLFGELTRQERDSNFADLSFDNNIFMTGIRLAY